MESSGIMFILFVQFSKFFTRLNLTNELMKIWRLPQGSVGHPLVIVQCFLTFASVCEFLTDSDVEPPTSLHPFLQGRRCGDPDGAGEGRP